MQLLVYLWSNYLASLLSPSFIISPPPSIPTPHFVFQDIHKTQNQFLATSLLLKKFVACTAILGQLASSFSGVSISDEKLN